MANCFWTLAVACAIGATGVTIAGGEATATGNVTDEAGKPVERATVMVYAAQIKKGYSPYCATCWADCGKRVVTDAAGSFSITGLNPDLVFKLIVMKDGYSGASIDNVDPEHGPAAAAILKSRAKIEDTSQVVRGRVVDGSGNPLKGAVVEQRGVQYRGPNGMGQMFGTSGWIDVVTASNDNGEFEMAYGKPAVAMMLNVEAHAMAPKLFYETTGAERKTLVITKGATIRGRLVGPDGKPVADAKVGLSTHSHFMSTALPEMTIGTREDGTFAITNVPAGRIWDLFPRMESLAARNLAGSAMACETKDDGQEVDVGDIRVDPGYTLRGKVVPSDGKPIPADISVLLSSETDTQIVPLAADGSFEFKGLAKGVYRVGPGRLTYRLPQGDPGEVLVQGDRKDVVVRVEPAPER